MGLYLEVCVLASAPGRLISALFVTTSTEQARPSLRKYSVSSCSFLP